jgi:hypothetical protein
MMNHTANVELTRLLSKLGVTTKLINAVYRLSSAVPYVKNFPCASLAARLSSPK